jgi:hypothetical protein
MPAQPLRSGSGTLGPGTAQQFMVNLNRGPFQAWDRLRRAIGASSLRRSSFSATVRAEFVQARWRSARS